MEPVKQIMNGVSRVVDRLTLPGREKKQLEGELLRVLVEYERERTAAQSAAVVEESRGGWLQRSWRPLVMLVFTLIILLGSFVELPILADTSRFWDLLEIGLGGYVVGRSGEKIARSLFGSKV